MLYFDRLSGGHDFFYDVFSVPISSYPMRILIPDPTWRCYELVVLSASGNTTTNREFTYQLKVPYSIAHATNVRRIELGGRVDNRGSSLSSIYYPLFEFRGESGQ